MQLIFLMTHRLSHNLNYQLTFNLLDVTLSIPTVVALHMNFFHATYINNSLISMYCTHIMMLCRNSITL